MQAHFGGKTVFHQPKALLFDPPKQSCLTFGLLWFSHPGSGPVWAPGGSVKVRTSLKSCVSSRIRFVMFFAIFSLRYGAQYLAVLTLICYITPYMMLFGVAVQMPPFGHCSARVRTDLGSVFCRNSSDFITIKEADFVGTWYVVECINSGCHLLCIVLVCKGIVKISALFTMSAEN